MKSVPLWLWVVLGLAVVGGGGYVAITKLPAGLRNKNPGNLMYNANIRWQGQVGKDSKNRLIFDTMHNGIRAMARDLMTKQGRGLNTIAKIIPVYAPAGDGNDVPAYIASVESQAKVGRDLPLMPYHLFAVLKAMIRHENGPGALVEISDDEIKAAIRAAGGTA